MCQYKETNRSFANVAVRLDKFTVETPSNENLLMST